MDLPQPPAPPDGDLRNIIDKLAQFVARNGPEFERMTKTKQKDNPKFGFLYGGEYFNYYQYKLTTNQAMMKHNSGRHEPDYPVNQYNMNQGMNSGSMHSNNSHNNSRNDGPQWLNRMGIPDQPPPQLMPPMGGPPIPGPPLPPNIPPPPAALEAIITQQTTMRDQIKQSESNLNAQHTVLIQQQQIRIEEAVANAQDENIQRLARENKISLPEFDIILQPIIDSCTKDSISTGKGWILSHSITHDASTAIAQYLLKKSTKSKATFIQKLHIIYLVNDVLHHCVRKNADDLKKCLELVVVPMFCNASLGIAAEQEAKLEKLLKLWESKSNYFDPSVIEKMKNPSTSYQEYQTNLISLYAHIITPLTLETKTTFENYQKQHQAFVAHTLQQIQQLEIQKQVIERQINAQRNPEPNIIPPNNMPPRSMPPNQKFNPNSFPDQMFPPQGPPGNSMMNYDQQQFCNNQPPMFSGVNQQCFPNNFGPPPNNMDGFDFENNFPPNRINNSNNDSGPIIPGINFSQPPPGFFNDNDFQNGLPDLSKPPPGFGSNTQEITAEDLIPPLPYYELPAGLMLSLIPLSDSEYKPINPDDLRLPSPSPPSERLLAALESFFTKNENPKAVDNDGWEKTNLQEYYKMKNAAKKQKEDAIKKGERPKSRSPSPINFDALGLKSPTIRRYRSKSRSISPAERIRFSPSHQRSPSPPSDRDQDRDRSRRRRRKSSPNVGMSPTGSQRSDKRSESPEMIGFRGTESKRSSGSRSSRPSERSPTPPSFAGSSYGNPNQLSEVDSTNKGHQMLRKMGWSGKGSGLGAAGQGISAPIDAGFIRDKQDQYKGLGVTMNDPFENFRKNKGAAFITRMKERALERTS